MISQTPQALWDQIQMLPFVHSFESLIENNICVFIYVTESKKIPKIKNNFTQQIVC